jgi:cytochrome c oxidase subunit IV
MSGQRVDKPRLLRLSLGYGVVWLALMLLLGANLGTAYLPLNGGAILHLGIAGLQALLVWLLFMNLLGSSGPIRLCAMAGMFWLIFLFALVLSDYLTRDWNGALAPFSERAASIEAKGDR